MTDLNAPLKPRKPTAKKPSQSHKTAAKSVGKRASVLVAATFLIAAGVNAAIWATNDNDAQDTALLILPEPIETASVPDVQTPQAALQGPQPARTENGVEIFYGSNTAPGNTGQDGVYAAIVPADQNDLPNAAAPAPLPGDRPNSNERRLSPGGAKVITIRDPRSASTGQPLEVAHLPESEALEDSPHGMLPTIANTGRRPMDIYARPWSRAGGKRIAIVIGGLGLSQTGTQRAIEALPPEITLGFSPVGNSLSRWMRTARKQGHELVVQVPMEPFGYPDVDPGPRTLRLASSSETNLENMHWAMGRLTNYTGVMNYLGGRLATDQNAMTPLLEDIGDRGLLFFNDGSVTAALGDLARRLDVPYAQADILIDGSRTPQDISRQLKALEDLANARGYAVGTGSALAMTVEAVADWANDAKKRGIEFVGISAIAQTRR